MILQKHFAWQRIRLFNVDKKFKKIKQRFKQFVNVLTIHINSFKNQFSKRFSNFIRINYLIFVFHDYIQQIIIKKQKFCTIREQIEKITFFIEHIEFNSNDHVKKKQIINDDILRHYAHTLNAIVTQRYCFHSISSFEIAYRETLSFYKHI